MLVAIVGVVLLALCLAVVIAIAVDQGPQPEDVAVSYEHAWDRLDFDVLWALSAAELRDGLDRKQFVAAKAAAYAERRELRGLGRAVTVDDSVVRRDNALVTTRVELRDGAVVQVRVTGTTIRPALIVEVGQDAVDVDPEAIQRFFEGDWREHPCGASGALRLAAAARTARLHGGRVDVKAASPRGCAVTFVIPRPLD